MPYFCRSPSVSKLPPDRVQNGTANVVTGLLVHLQYHQTVEPGHWRMFTRSGKQGCGSFAEGWCSLNLCIPPGGGEINALKCLNSRG